MNQKEKEKIGSEIKKLISRALSHESSVTINAQQRRQAHIGLNKWLGRKELTRLE
jgi:hypothetical protein